MVKAQRSLHNLTIYTTSRPWWRKHWQAEPADERVDWPEWSRAVTGWTIWDTAARAVERDYRARGRRVRLMQSGHELMPKTWRTRLDIWWQHHPTSPKRWIGRLKQKAGETA